MDRNREMPLRKHWPMLRQYAGFTLAELLTSLSITSVMGLGVIPGMIEIVSNNRITSTTNTFISHLYLTRSEAIKTGHNVIMCPSKLRDQCNKSSEWHHGWIVFVDTNQNLQYDSNERLIQVHEATSRVDIRSGSRRYRVKYRPEGSSYSSNTTFTFCDERGADSARAIILSPSGRPRSSRVNPYNKPLKCV
jgi:type IV fimbrial biogenesis protein FimT